MPLIFPPTPWLRRQLLWPAQRRKLDAHLKLAIEAGLLDDARLYESQGAHPDMSQTLGRDFLFIALESLGPEHPVPRWLFERWPSLFGNGAALGAAALLHSAEWIEKLIPVLSLADQHGLNILTRRLFDLWRTGPAEAESLCARCLGREPRFAAAFAIAFATYGASGLLSATFDSHAGQRLGSKLTQLALSSYAKNRYWHGTPSQLASSLLSRLIHGCPPKVLSLARIAGHRDSELVRLIGLAHGGPLPPPSAKDYAKIAADMLRATQKAGSDSDWLSELGLARHANPEAAIELCKIILSIKKSQERAYWSEQRLSDAMDAALSAAPRADASDCAHAAMQLGIGIPMWAANAEAQILTQSLAIGVGSTPTAHRPNPPHETRRRL